MFRLVIVASSLLLSACAAVSESYVYAPKSANENPAEIEFTTGVGAKPYYNFIKNDEMWTYDHGVVLRWIDDKFVSPWFKNSHVKDNKLLLSPKTTKLGFQVLLKNGGGELETTLDVKAAEKYKLHIGGGKLWITDKNKKIVKEIKYKVQKTYTSVPIMVPKFR